MSYKCDVSLNTLHPFFLCRLLCHFCTAFLFIFFLNFPFSWTYILHFLWTYAHLLNTVLGFCLSRSGERGGGGAKQLPGVLCDFTDSPRTPQPPTSSLAIAPPAASIFMGRGNGGVYQVPSSQRRPRRGPTSVPDLRPGVGTRRRGEGIVCPQWFPVFSHFQSIFVFQYFLG